MDAEKLFNNLVYFLEAIGPVCEKYDIKMGIHPDDPAWPIFGLPRIMTGKDSVTRLLDAVDKAIIMELRCVQVHLVLTRTMIYVRLLRPAEAEFHLHM